MPDFLSSISDWVQTIPLPALYALLAIAAFIEGIFPPLPADVLVALGSFLAVRRGASFAVTVTCVVVGSVGGAMTIYFVARRFGAAWLHAKLKKAGIDNLEQRLEVMYSRYGMGALFVSRFVPGLRAVAPPMAGATKIPPVRTAVVFLAASTIWYGTISWIAFRVGDDWEQLQVAVRTFAQRVGGAAGIAAAIVVTIVIIVLKRRARRKLAEARPVEELPED